MTIPYINFPPFPLADSMNDNHDGTVSVPARWLVELEEYHIRITETELLYEEMRTVYDSD